jgi:alpha-L-rhamnosidase
VFCSFLALSTETLFWTNMGDMGVSMDETQAKWTAKFITAPKTFAPNGALRPVLLRKPFKVPAKIQTAQLSITAQGSYEAYINGTRVGNHVLAPGWTSYNYYLNFQTFDVKDLLNKGENTIGVEVGEGWFCTRLGFGGGRRNIYGDRMTLLAQLVIMFEDGKCLKINSDGSWRSAVGPIISSEIYDGEVYDASLIVEGWNTSAFNDKGWSGVEELEDPPTNLLPPKGPPVRRIETIKPQSILKSPSGKTIIDFGQNLVGRLQVRVTGKEGERIVFTHTEVLEYGECATRPLRDCKATDTLILSGKPIEWEPKFTFHGFRYVQVEGWPSSELSQHDIEAVVLHSDLKRTGWFECSDTMVNKLHECIRWGMKGNFLSIPTDCPQRDERLGWTGDIQIFAPTANFLYDTSGMLSNWLQQLAVEQLKDYNGVPPLVCPNVIDDIFPKTQAAWADAAILTPYDLYQSFGDTKILYNQYTSMKAWIDQGLPRQASGLWDPSVYILGDWLDPAAPPDDPANGKTDPHFVANAYLIRITDTMIKVSRILDIQDDCKRYTADAARLRKEFQNEYITPNGRLAPDTMTSLSLALSINLFRSSTETAHAATRLATLVRSSGFRIATGFVGTPLILPVLTAHGHTDLAYRMLLEQGCPSWLYPITMGATTMWERWDSMLPDGRINPGSMTSFNHYALGSVGAWLHETVGGIAPIEPGWKKIKIEPVPGGDLTWAKVRFESIYGMVACEWKIENGKFSMKATVPKGTTAIVKAPGQEAMEVGSGVHDYSTDYVAGEWPPQAIKDLFAS